MALISNKSIDTNMFTKLKNHINSSDEIYMSVSFIKESGLKLIIDDLKKAKDQGKKIKILTSDYLNITEPNALYRLLNLENTKIFKNTKNISFHPKAYIFKNNQTKKVDVYIGSSNISRSALTDGIEWNHHISKNFLDKEIEEIINSFDELYEESSFDLTIEWLREYEKNYRENYLEHKKEERTLEIIEPIRFQIPALYELSLTREEGYNKGLVIVATGLGKTYLAIFDSMNYKRILFVAHREEILLQGKNSFEKIYGNKKTYGFFNGSKKEIGKDITFANISTIGKTKYLNESYFSKNYFDYIVIDEVHHGTGKNYQKLLNYFEPKFLLGLTATPERMDNGDIYKICDYNIVYECNFIVGINNGWLSPFEYFGIYDCVDYSSVPWRSGKYDLKELENALIVEERARLIYKKYLYYRKKKSIAFCASVKHAEYMNKFFREKGIRTSVLTGKSTSEKRKREIQQLKDGNIDIIFVVDIFNEGVDIPAIDTVLLLRPTSSYTIFMQQIGRGLRLFEGKSKLRILDFVGNYKGAEFRCNFLTGETRKGGSSLLPTDEQFILPKNCTSNFDFQLIDFLLDKKNLSEKRFLRNILIEEYKKIKEDMGKIPSLLDIYTYSEEKIYTYIKEFGSWDDFLLEVGDLEEYKKLYKICSEDFLKYLEKTSMTKLYKLPLFLSLFKGKIKQRVTAKEIGLSFKEFYRDENNALELTGKKHEGYKDWEANKFFDIIAKGDPIKHTTGEVNGAKFFKYDKKNKIYFLDHSLYVEIKENEKLQRDILDRIELKRRTFLNKKFNIKL